MNTILNFLIRQYASQIKSAIAHALAALVAGGMAWVLVKWPGFDSFCTTYIGQQPAAIALSISGTLAFAFNALMTALANNPAIATQDPELAAIAKAISTARVLPESAPQTIDLPHSQVVVTPVDRTVKPAGAPTNEGKGLL